MSFVHLHVHTEYSLLDGQSRVPKLVEAAKAMDMPALAITDHGALYGVPEFYRECQKQGVKPLIGMEGYLAPGGMREREGRYDYSHLLLLARNNRGYANLLRLTTLSHTHGYYQKPRVDRALLEECGYGLIATSGCLAGEIPRLLMAGRDAEARERVRWYQDVFDCFYLELQDHGDVAIEQRELNAKLIALHKETGVDLVATNDLHYVHASDANTHDLLLCVQMGKQQSETDRMKFDGPEYYLKSPEEMRARFAAVPSAIRNTLAVAEDCNVTIEWHRELLPRFPIPAEFETDDQYLTHLVDEGHHRRFAEMTDEMARRLVYELDIIAMKGYVPYFLIVHDYVEWARKRGIRCVARGSAAGSLVAYCLGITNVDPLRYNLLFERFLNPDRVSMPDIDVDFPDDRRDEVIRYLAERWGWERTAQLLTFNRLQAKYAVRDVGRVLGQSSEADRIARLVPANVPGEAPKTLADAQAENSELRSLVENSPTMRHLTDEASQLEGAVRSIGVHAAGVVISREPLITVCPLQLRDPKDPHPWLLTGYDAHTIEDLGLLKFDMLSLSNLTILLNAVRHAQALTGDTIDLDRLPQDDPATYALISSGETTGIFQFESPPMRRYLTELKPERLEDLMAMVALYRPGPMDSIPDFIAAKQGRKEINYLDPRLEPILHETYGVIAYQDQVLQVALQLAGYSWGEVDVFRKAMGKKIAREMAAQEQKFLDGCLSHGCALETAKALWHLISPFAGYGFGKAHACAYAMVAYQTAYLKTHYPIAFFAATLTAESGEMEKIAAAVAECRRMNVAVLPIDVNLSDAGFTATKEGVRFGLLAIKSLGTRAAQDIIRAREEGGVFAHIADLAARTALPKNAIEALIKAGACDVWGTRAAQLAAVPQAVALGAQARGMLITGQATLFGDSPLDSFTLPDVAEQRQDQLLAAEKELLGLYLSAHPLQHLSHVLRRLSTLSCAQVDETRHKQQVTLAGRLTSLRTFYTKKGDAMAVGQLEDLTGSAKVTLFPQAYSRYSELWREDAVVVVGGVLERRDIPGRDSAEPGASEVSLLIDTLEAVDDALIQQEEAEPFVRYKVVLVIDSETVIAAVRDILAQHPGDDVLEVVVPRPDYVARLGNREQGILFSHSLYERLLAVLPASHISVDQYADERLSAVG